MDETDAVAEALLQALEPFGGVGQMFGAFGLGFVDQRADPVDPLAGVERAADRRRSPRRYGSSGIARVSIGCRPAGFSRNSETSMSPK